MKFKYSGPTSGVDLNMTPKSETPEYKEFTFFDGVEYDLPEDSPYVKGLIALGHLTKIETTDGKKTIKKEATHVG